MKGHLLRCSQKSKNRAWEEQLSRAMLDTDWTCEWAKCNTGSFHSAELAAAHVTDHLSLKQFECQWRGCDKLQTSIVALHTHLLDSHGVHTEATIPTRAKFCYECAQWTSSELDWDLHTLHHVHNPHIIYGPINMDGILAAPRRCPYCLERGKFLQMENQTQYIEHVENHIFEELETSELLECPHLFCERKLYEARELRLHFQVVHAISFS
jgi:hypothetical protein